MTSTVSLPPSDERCFPEQKKSELSIDPAHLVSYSVSMWFAITACYAYDLNLQRSHEIF